MPVTLREGYQKFSQPSFKKGYVAAFYQRGMTEIFGREQWDAMNKGDSHRFLVQAGLPGKRAARHPMDTNTKPPSGRGRVHDIRVYATQFLRDFETPIAAQKTMDDTNDPVATDAEFAAHRFFEEFIENLAHGDGSFQLKTSGAAPSILGNNMCGWDFWLDQYAGKIKEGAFTSSSADGVLWYNPGFRGQKMWATENEMPTLDRTKRMVFGHSIVDAGLSLIKGSQDRITIISDRLSWLRFLNTLRAAGGNTQTMLVDEQMGGEVVSWDGRVWLISDAVGAPKVHEGGTGVGAKILVGDLDTLIIDGEGEDDFIGFSDLDIGRVVRVEGADFSGAAGHSTAVNDKGQALADNETRIKQIVDNRTVILEHAAGGAVAVGAAFDSDPVPVTYIHRFGGTHPTHIAYAADKAANERSYSVDAGEYYGSIMGFDVRYIGEKQQGGAVDMYRMEWDGNQVVEDPYSIVRIAGYKLG